MENQEMQGDELNQYMAKSIDQLQLAIFDAEKTGEGFLYVDSNAKVTRKTKQEIIDIVTPSKLITLT